MLHEAFKGIEVVIFFDQNLIRVNGQDDAFNIHLLRIDHLPLAERPGRVYMLEIEGPIAFTGLKLDG